MIISDRSESFTAVTKDIENLTAGTYVCRITDKTVVN